MRFDSNCVFGDKIFKNSLQDEVPGINLDGTMGWVSYQTLNQYCKALRQLSKKAWFPSRSRNMTEMETRWIYFVRGSGSLPCVPSPTHSVPSPSFPCLSSSVSCSRSATVMSSSLQAALVRPLIGLIINNAFTLPESKDVGNGWTLAQQSTSYKTCGISSINKKPKTSRYCLLSLHYYLHCAVFSLISEVFLIS